MTNKRNDARPIVALGLRAQRGGAVAVAVALDGRRPRLIVSGILATGAEGDPLSLEPYRIARNRAVANDARSAAEAVAEGRKRQDACAVENLRKLLQIIADADGETTAAALLVNRAGWVGDLFAYALQYPEHLPVAEGLAVREALRAACAAAELALVEIDEKTLPETAAARFGAEALDATLTAMGKAAGKPWRREQKFAAMAAWITLAHQDA